MDIIFGAKSVVGPEKCFSPSDLLKYVESLLREAKLREMRSTGRSNYDWLKSKAVYTESYDVVLGQSISLTYKMTSESCATIAVKLEQLAEETSLSFTDIINTFKKLLQEQDNMQMINKNVIRAKGIKNSKINKVHPELLPPRQATVSFIVERKIL